MPACDPSWQSGRDGLPTFSKRVYGRGETAEKALFNATHFRRNGQWWSYGSGSGHPNASDLSVEEVDDEEVDSELLDRVEEAAEFAENQNYDY
jgi:hypothetical protein